MRFVLRFAIAYGLFIRIAMPMQSRPMAFFAMHSGGNGRVDDFRQPC